MIHGTHYQVLVGTSPVDSDSCHDYLTTSGNCQQMTINFSYSTVMQCMASPHCHHRCNGWGWHKGLGVLPYLRVLETCQSARQLTGKLKNRR